MELKVNLGEPYVSGKRDVLFKVSEVSLDNHYLDSNDWTYFGYKTKEELTESGDNEAYKHILQSLYHSIEIIEGGRLDLLVRTHEGILRELADIGKGEDTYLKLMTEHLEGVSPKDYGGMYRLESVNDAVYMVDHDYLGEDDLLTKDFFT